MSFTRNHKENIQLVEASEIEKQSKDLLADLCIVSFLGYLFFLLTPVNKSKHS